MKKIIFGSASALLAVVGFSSFKNLKAADTTYYWFSVPAANNVSTSVTHPTFSQVGGETAFLGFVPQTSLDVACSGSADLCIVGYTLGSIRGFTSGGTPTGFKTIGGGTGEAKPYTTRGGVAQPLD